MKKSIIRRVKEAAKIEDVCRTLLPDIKKAGVEYTARCPFHEDRHLGNFKISPKKNLATCFSCGWHGDPIKFVMEYLKVDFKDAIRHIAKIYNIDTDMEDLNITIPVRPTPPPLPMLTLPMSMVTSRSRLSNDNLAAWMWRGINWDSNQRDRLLEALIAYHVGHSNNGMTIWWQIDEQQRVRTGKMMRYNADGHRVKDKGYNADWIHSVLFHDQRHPEYDEDKQEMKQCLFGLHLLNAYKVDDVEQTVCLVESEKTAVIMAAAYGNHPGQIWMATGGLRNLTREKLRPLINENRPIVCYPDRDGIDEWKIKVEQLHYNKCKIDTKPVTDWWRECDGPKADIADVVVRMINEGSRDVRTHTIRESTIQLANQLNLQTTP